MTRAQAREDAEPREEREPVGPLKFQSERWRRIRAHQGQDSYLAELTKFLKGD
ncbi:hypothetical protein V7S43_013827, partial [Phytophthora oleae]